MGEFSRTIGELGENITLDSILKKIGWRGVQNFDIKCVSKLKHKKGKHGIDLYAAYQDPLVLNTLVNLVVSVKYNESTSIRADFIEIAEDLSAAAECIKVDKTYTDASRESRLGKKKHPCVIFWLNHNSNDDRSLLKKLIDVNSDIKNRFEAVYLIDNYRINFLYKAITFVESLYPQSTLEFDYPDTGVNDPIDGGREQSGKILPVEFINSPVLPFRIIINNQQKVLVLCLNESFGIESLRRLLGLAEGLTSGWCNKIVLGFPDYQASKHEQIRDSAFMSFSKSNFSDMIEVRSFNNSFKNLERTEIIEFSDAPEHTAGINSSLNTMLPYGDRIRQLLVQSYIYKQDLQILLNKRGVFVDKYSNKSELIPLISKTLLSPSEFEYLRRKQINKESAKKISSENIFVGENLSNEEIIPLLNSFDKELIDKIIEDNNYNCKLVGAPSFDLDENGDIRLNFKIQREDLTKDWASASAYFDGQVTLKPVASNAEGSFCRVENVSTSTETKLISQHVIEYLIKQLKDNGLISTGAIAKKLLASSLASRSNFLFSFIANSNTFSESIRFQELIGIEFRISNNSQDSISEDVESLRNKVDKSVFSGHGLEDIKYVSDPKYREVFDYYIMVCIFNIKAPFFNGKMQIEFGFPDLKAKSADKAEFEYKILELLPIDESATLSVHEHHEIELAIREEFNNMKDFAYSVAEKSPHQIDIEF